MSQVFTLVTYCLFFLYNNFIAIVLVAQSLGFSRRLDEQMINEGLESELSVLMGTLQKLLFPNSSSQIGDCSSALSLTGVGQQKSEKFIRELLKSVSRF